MLSTGVASQTTPPPRHDRPRRMVDVAIVVGCTAAVWVVAFASVALGVRATRAPKVQQLVIPAGTAARMEAGDANPLAIPPSWDFVVGDTLQLVNHDRVTHTLGPWQVQAGRTRSVRFGHAADESYACSVHPSGKLAITVQARRVDLGLTVVPTLVLGPLVGLVLVVIRAVLRRVDIDG